MYDQVLPSSFPSLRNTCLVDQRRTMITPGHIPSFLKRSQEPHVSRGRFSPLPKKHSSTTWTSAGVVFLSGPYVDLLRSFLFVTFKLSSSGIFCSSSPDDHRKQRSSASSCVRLSSSHCVTSPTKIPPLAECIQRSTDMHRLNRNARRLHNSMCHARPIQARFVMDVPF